MDTPGPDASAITEQGGEQDPARMAARERVREALFGAEGERRVGRFHILHSVGRGGMGEVFAAYDPELDRRVAVKLVLGDVGDSQGRARMMAEARAMAKISHPNVLPVFDVGTNEEGALFIAMEFVQGSTLRAWLEAEQRSWREKVDAYLAAGRGLAAAHAIGLVHRDFKPDNVMIGDDARVRVLDFGLARSDGSSRGAAVPVTSGPTTRGTGTGADSSERSITQTGAIVGTLAYIAPEQLLGGKADERSDQFSFCIALYEALEGARPFTTRDAIVSAAALGDAPPPMKNPAVPTWLMAVVMRGLEPRPENRWATMDDLLAALAADPPRRRRRWLLAAGVLAVGGALASAKVVADRRALARCEEAGHSVADLWNASVRADVEAAVRASGASYAEDTWQRLAPALDQHAQQWSSARTEACLATEVNQVRSRELYDLSVACLQERSDEFAAVVGLLARADEAVAVRAMELVSDLEPIGRCRDAAWLLTRPDPPGDAQRDEVGRLRRELASASALRSAGRYEESLVQAQSLLIEARELDYVPLTVAVMLIVGDDHGYLGQRDQAIAYFRDAFYTAGRIADDGRAGSAAVSLVFQLGADPSRLDEADTWARMAEMTLARSGQLETALHGRLLGIMGGLAEARGDLARAVELQQRALGIVEATYGPEHILVARVLTGMSTTQRLAGKPDQARASLDRALAITRSALGPNHPEVGGHLINLGAVAKDQGRLDESLGHLQLGYDLQRAAFGDEHEGVAKTLHGLGSAYYAKGEYAKAEEYLERAAATFRATVGEDHVDLAGCLLVLANTRWALGRADEAVRDYQSAQAVFESALGPEHPNVAAIANNLGTLAMSAGRYDEAEKHFARALAIWEKKLGPDHPNVAVAITNQGNLAGQREDYAGALASFQRALAIREKAVGPLHPSLASIFASMADAYLESGRPIEAMPWYGRALGIREAVVGRSHPDLVAILLGLGRAAAKVHDDEEARGWFERALIIVDAGEVSAHECGAVRKNLAELLVDVDRSRARALAEQALLDYRLDGSQDQVAKVTAWLEAHPPARAG